MVAPVASSYSVAAGQPIYGGRLRAGVFAAGATLGGVSAGGGLAVPGRFTAGATLASVIGGGAFVSGDITATPAPAAILNESGSTSIRGSGGMGFRPGDIPAGNILTSPDFAAFQGVVLNRWPDGSVKFAAVACRGTKPNNATTAISVSGTAGSLSGAVAESVLAAAIAATPAVITLAGVGSVALADLIGVTSTLSGGRYTAGRVRTNFEGPLCSSWTYYSRVAGHAHLSAWFEVRCWDDGAVEILPWVENGWWNITAPTAWTGTASFSLGGVTQVSLSLTLHHHTRAALLPANPEPYRVGANFATLLHDPAYLQQTDLVSAYHVAPNETKLASLGQTYTPMAAGNEALSELPSSMGGQGYTPSIGPASESDVCFITTADKRARRNVLLNGCMYGRFAIHYRDETTNRIVAPGAYPSWVLNSTESGIASVSASATNSYTPTPSGSGPTYYFAVSHHPSAGDMAYMATGWHFFVEEAQAAAAVCCYRMNSIHRQNEKHLFRGDVTDAMRGSAWGTRSVAKAASFTPDGDALQTAFLGVLQANIDFNHATYVAQANNQFGFMADQDAYTPAANGTVQSGSTDTVIQMGLNAVDGLNAYVGWTLTISGVSRTVTAYEYTTRTATVGVAFPSAPSAGTAWNVTDNKQVLPIWMHDFMTAAQGLMLCIAPLDSTYRNKQSEFFQWKARSVVGRLGAPGASTAFNYINAGQFTLAGHPTDNPDVNGGTGPFYSDWGAIYTATLGIANTANPGGTETINTAFGSWPNATGSWAILMGALAYAVRHEVPDADVALARVMSDSAWSSFTTSLASNPVWGLKARVPQWPSWRRAQTANTFVEIPVAAPLSTLGPHLLPAINPNFPAFPEYMSAGGTSWASLCTAWNGGCYDTRRDHFYAGPITGGHADYAGNDMIVLELRSEVPTWYRRSLPTGWNGAVATNDQARLVSGSGSTVVFPAGTQAPLLWDGSRDEASAVDDAYNGMTLNVFAQTSRTITDYVGATRTATVSPPFTVDMANRLFSVSNGPMVLGLNGEKSGRYADGRARSVHTYNIPVYAERDDSPWMPVGGSGYSWTASQGNSISLRVDRATGDHTFSTGPNSTITSAPFGAATASDPTRGPKGSIWYFGQGGTVFGRLDLATRTWTQSASCPARGGEQCLVRLPLHDLLLLGGTGSPWAIYDPKDNTWTNITVTGTPAGGNTSFGKAQLCYVLKDNSVYWWNNPTGSTTLLNKMTVPANPKTGTWTITQTTPHASNSVTPTPAQGNGTYGRFRHSVYLDEFIFFNDVAGPVYGYARANAA